MTLAYRETGQDSELLIGIDLGTSRTAVATSQHYRAIIRSVVGYPRDIIGAKLLGALCVFGDEALDKSSAVDLYMPLKDGVIKEGQEKEQKAAQDLLEHVVTEARQGHGGRLCGIIGVPARASILNKEMLLGIASRVLDVSVVVSQPFMVAYYMNKLHNCIVVDLGAGTVDVCGMKGTVPTAEDQVTILKAGEYIDERLAGLIGQEHPDVQLSRTLVRTIKEAHAFVGPPAAPVLVTLRDSDGRPHPYDLTEEIRTVCESIVGDVVEQVKVVLRSFAPEHQAQALQNIYLAGGGSRIKGLDRLLVDQLGECGEAQVTCVDDPDYAGCEGALRLATDLRPEYWSQLGVVARREAPPEPAASPAGPASNQEEGGRS
ncbi:MAG: MamK family actin-like protein [Thermodesulfobacteriota bacterium]